LGPAGKPKLSPTITTHNDFNQLRKISQDDFSQKQRTQNAKFLFDWVTARREDIQRDPSPFASIAPLFPPYPPRSEDEAEALNQLFKPCKKSENHCTCADCWDLHDDPWSTIGSLTLPHFSNGAVSILKFTSDKAFLTAQTSRIYCQSLLIFDLMASFCNSLHAIFISNITQLSENEAIQIKTVIASLCQSSSNINAVAKDISSLITPRHERLITLLFAANMDVENFITMKWHEPFLISSQMLNTTSAQHSQDAPQFANSSQESVVTVKSSHDSMPMIADQFEIEVAARVELAREALKSAELLCHNLRKSNCQQVLEKLLEQRASLSKETCLCQRVAEDYPNSKEHIPLNEKFNTHFLYMFTASKE